MSLNIYFPNVGDGECFIAIHKNDAGDTQSIMIDCGSFSDYVRDIVVNQLNKHIDCLVISHFDDDHTLGIITMLIEIPDLSINKILFNYAPIIDGVEQDMDKQECLQKIKPVLKDLSAYLPLEDNTNIGAKEGVSLTALFFNNPQWKDKLQSKVVVTNSIDDAIDLGELGKLFIISPFIEQLNEQGEKYKSEYTRYFFEKVTSLDASLYEVILRLAERKEKEEEQDYEDDMGCRILNAELINKLSKTNYSNDSSKNNASSIAFVWEYNDKRFLFTGDARADVLVKGLERYKSIKAITDDTIFFDIIKIPHHGSKHNMSKELRIMIDSSIFLICGKYKETTPSIETISKIICKELPNGIDKRCIYFNLNSYKNDEITAFLKSNLEDTKNTIKPYKTIRSEGLIIEQ